MMFHFKNKPKTKLRLSGESGAGYIALMSAIVISFLLVAITVSLGFNGFFGRFNILDSESKERSNALAEACGDTAILNLAKGLTTTGNIAVGSDSCNIVSVQNNIPLSGQTTIQTQACVNKSFTNLKIVINNNFGIISWEELPNFSPNNLCP